MLLQREDIYDLQYYSLLGIIILNSKPLIYNNMNINGKILYIVSLGSISILLADNIYKIYKILK